VDLPSLSVTLIFHLSPFTGIATMTSPVSLLVTLKSATIRNLQTKKRPEQQKVTQIFAMSDKSLILVVEKKG
jgi:hypothetical protein